MSVNGGDRASLRDAVDGRSMRMRELAERACESGRATKLDVEGLRAAGRSWFEDSGRRAAPSGLIGASHWPALADAYGFLDQVDDLAKGMTRVRVVFDHGQVASHASGAALPFLASCAVDYGVGYVPTDAWVVERSSVVIGCPTTDASSGVIRSTDPVLVKAVTEYLDAIAGTAYRVERLVREPMALTRRQHAIAAVLLEVDNDDAAARALGVSVRTLHREVDRLYETFGVSYRLALGLAYGRATVGWDEAERLVG